MAVQAQAFRLKLLFTTAPGLGEGMFLGVGAPALQALGESFILLPPGGPFVDSHNFVAMADGRVDFHRVTAHDFGPFPGVDLDHGLVVGGALNLGAEVAGNVLQTHFILLSKGCYSAWMK